ncbi:39S ribosomal protein L1-like [Homarus americanus]|uniref:39S ribosomal protein L1-like n=1 Tax=Homarus americanus TaxID=6706 RepID=A0A8J5JNH9_HOMAM|nr:39S ribosomal protein L1-like [Homarus americanus]
MHRETHHDSQFGLPDALVKAYVELDMSADKKNRFVDNFSNVAGLPHNFNTEQNRTILAISRDEDVLEQAREMGVTHAAGIEIIKQVQNGEVNLPEYQHFIAETELLSDLVAIRGLMKRRFPSVKNGTAGSNILPIIERFIKGVDYRTVINKHHLDFATIEAPFGRLNMLDDQLEENLASLLNDIENQSPQKKSNKLVYICCLPSTEQFKIDHTAYIIEKTRNVKARAVA